MLAFLNLSTKKHLYSQGLRYSKGPKSEIVQIKKHRSINTV